MEAKTGVSSKAILVKIDSNSEIDAKDAVRKLQDQHNITHLDVVIANAGQNNYFSPVRAVTMAEMRQVLEVNSYAPIILFQAVLPLLEKSSKPIFATMGSMMGTIGAMEQRPFPCTSYGVSKAALNWITRKVHCEHENIIAFVLDPGYVTFRVRERAFTDVCNRIRFVQTDMGNEGARLIGLEKAYTTVDECVEGLVKGVGSPKIRSRRLTALLTCDIILSRSIVPLERRRVEPMLHGMVRKFRGERHPPQQFPGGVCGPSEIFIGYRYSVEHEEIQVSRIARDFFKLF